MSDELGVGAGQIIAGKYRLQELLGRGGMGSVWRCDHLSLMSSIAVKIIKPEVARNPNSVARFMREAKAAAMLRSPHIIQILDHGLDGKIAYIAMELLEGVSLLRRIKNERKLSAAETSTIMTHVGRAMQKAHDVGVIHRDLKPDNIFLVENDDEVIAKVLDFGIAKSALFALNATGESPQTQTGALLGTPYYMSPEQATGQKDVDHRSDLWALGVITFECLIGRRPYQSDSLGDLVLQICSRAQPVPSHCGRVPPGFDEWFARAQKRDPDERFQSSKDMTRALRDVLVGGRASAPLTISRTVGVPTPMAGTPLVAGSDLSSSAIPLVSHSMPATEPAAQPMAAQPPNTDKTYASAGASSSGQFASSSGQFASTPMEGSVSRAGVRQTQPELGLETLDPLAATAVPRRRRQLMVGAVLGGLCLVAGGVASYHFATRDSGATAVDTGREEAAAPAAPASSAPQAPTPPPIAAQPPPVAAPVATVEVSASVEIPVPLPQARNRPTAPPPPVPKGQPPPPVPVIPKPIPKPVPDDPLGI
jgi:serine/threonine protein kinase